MCIGAQFGVEHDIPYAMDDPAGLCGHVGPELPVRRGAKQRGARAGTWSSSTSSTPHFRQTARPL